MWNPNFTGFSNYLQTSANPPTIQASSNVWSELDDVTVDAEKFINLFLLKSKDTPQKVRCIDENVMR